MHNSKVEIYLFKMNKMFYLRWKWSFYIISYYWGDITEQLSSNTGVMWQNQNCSNTTFVREACCMFELRCYYWVLSLVLFLLFLLSLWVCLSNIIEYVQWNTCTEKCGRKFWLQDLIIVFCVMPTFLKSR